jgi:tRNA pseudouridine38-40 synthase
MSTTYKLVLEYHGGHFFGWAAQPGFETVEQTLLDGLAQVLGEAPALTAAGRTDAGVHARGQVVSFAAPDGAPEPGSLQRSLNGVLPPQVAVVAAESAPDGFDARRDARSRTYRYRLLARPAPSPFEHDRALWWPYPVDEQTMSDCARLLPGRHDFTAFTPTRTEHVRFERDVLWAEWRRVDPVLEFWIEADTFMRHMVRVLVGTMLEAGAGRREPAAFAELLRGAPRSDAGPTAEPHGLFLERVSY